MGHLALTRPETRAPPAGGGRAAPSLSRLHSSTLSHNTHVFMALHKWRVTKTQDGGNMLRPASRWPRLWRDQAR